MNKGGREEVFELGLERTALLKPIPECRFDFARPKHCAAAEIEGISCFDTRQQRLAGFLAYVKQYEEALMLRRTVYRVSGRGKRRHRDTCGGTT